MSCSSIIICLIKYGFFIIRYIAYSYSALIKNTFTVQSLNYKLSNTMCEINNNKQGKALVCDAGKFQTCDKLIKTRTTSCRVGTFICI